MSLKFSVTKELRPSNLNPNVKGWTASGFGGGARINFSKVESESLKSILNIPTPSNGSIILIDVDVKCNDIVYNCTLKFLPNATRIERLRDVFAAVSAQVGSIVTIQCLPCEPETNRIEFSLDFIGTPPAVEQMAPLKTCDALSIKVVTSTKKEEQQPESMEVDTPKAVEEPLSFPFATQQQQDEQQQQQVEEYKWNPVNGLNVSSWKRCTPSYVLLPTDYPKHEATGRTALSNAVANDDLVSVCASMHIPAAKTKQQVALLDAEDNHYELQVLLDQTNSAIKALTPMAEAIAVMTDEERAEYQYEEGKLRGFHFFAIRSTYGKKGSEMINQLRQNPAVTIPAVLARLIQKSESLVASKAKMVPQMQKVFDKNFEKSLDHSSVDKKVSASVVKPMETPEPEPAQRQRRIVTVRRTMETVERSSRFADENVVSSMPTTTTTSDKENKRKRKPSAALLRFRETDTILGDNNKKSRPIN